MTFTPHGPGSDRPGRWDPRGPGPTPADQEPRGLDPWLEQRMFDQGVVLAQGVLTPTLGTRVAAQLLTLEASGGERIRLHLRSPDGDLDAAFAVVDAIDLIRVPVEVVAVGEVGGAALAVYAAGDRRLAYQHARFRLAEPRVERVHGTADQILGVAQGHLRVLEELIVRLAEATGRSRAETETDLGAVRVMDASEAVEYGLVHELIRKG